MHEPTFFRLCCGRFFRRMKPVWALWLASLWVLAPLLPAQDAPPAILAPPPLPGPALAPGPQAVQARPLAIVALDMKIPGAAAKVTGASQVFNGRAFIGNSGAVTAGPGTTQVTMPYRGTLRVCTSTTVKLAADSSTPAGETPGLMMSMENGAIEVSFATAHDSDVLLTPDFRILVGGPGAVEVKVRLGANGDTCVDNAKVNAPDVLVSSVFDGASYRVQAGQRVMFQHGSLHEVVDQEKEPCGCPAAGKDGNEFPLAQSEGLAPTLHPAPIPMGPIGQAAQTTDALVYNAADHAPKPAEAAPATGAPPPAATADAPPAAPKGDAIANPPVNPPAAVNPPPTKQKKPGKLHSIGHFFKRLFGAD